MPGNCPMQIRSQTCKHDKYTVRLARPTKTQATQTDAEQAHSGCASVLSTGRSTYFFEPEPESSDECLLQQVDKSPSAFGADEGGIQLLESARTSFEWPSFESAINTGAHKNTRVSYCRALQLVASPALRLHAPLASMSISHNFSALVMPPRPYLYPWKDAEATRLCLAQNSTLALHKLRARLPPKQHPFQSKAS
eukprot:2378314-Pleurochrysis_carterae.AAC.1